MTLSVVIVDDERADRYITRRVVQDAGIDGKVIEYKAGDEFLAVVTDEETRIREIGTAPPPMLVFLDINMPRMNGFEVLKAIEQCCGDGEMDPECMIVLMFSSSSHAEDKADAFSYSFVKDYVIKPLT